MPRPLAPDVMASTAGHHDAVHDHILDATHRVIARDGLAAASTRSIALEAGISVGTLYNYFSDRRELLVGSMLRRATVLTAPLSELSSLAGQATVAENLHRFAREIGAVLDQLVPLFGAVFSDSQLLEAHRRALPDGHGSTGPFAKQPIIGYLLGEQRLGRVSPEADCQAAAALLLSLCHERAFLTYFLGESMGEKTMVGEIDLITKAISPT